MWDVYQAPSALAVVLVSCWCEGPGALLCWLTVPVMLSM